MSSRVLRKLQGDRDLKEEISDNEVDLPVSGGARRKQLNINRYDLLNQQSHSESEVKEDDNETEANKSCDGDMNNESVKRKKKKKKKKSGKHVNTQRSSEDNADIDEVERSVREVNKLLGSNFIPKIPSATSKPEKSQRKNVLSIQHKHLNPNNELKRIFGAKIIQSEHKRKNRGGRGHMRTTWLVAGKDNWPQTVQSGLSMTLVEAKKGGLQYFTFEHSPSYRQLQNVFFEAVESSDPDNIVAIIKQYPYHIDALIQLSELCKLSEDLAMAADLIERALFCLECAFHSAFNIALGTCRLDYRRQENRAFFIAILKHLLFVGDRACYRTALEFCKLLLSLDPDGDPLAVKLIIDFYAIRAKEYNWLIEFTDEFEPTKNLSQLPNFAFSVALAHFHISNGDQTKADLLLQDALLLFPGVLMPLLENCSIQVDPRVSSHSYFGLADTKQSTALTQLIKLYVNRSYHIWKEADVLPWLETNVHRVLDRVDRGDPLVAEYESRRAKRYQFLPTGICRHILLSDVKGVTAIPEGYSGRIFAFDPLPPTDTINIYNRPKTNKEGKQNMSTVGVFFRSFFPSFNENDLSNTDRDREMQDVAGAGAVAGTEELSQEYNDFRRSLASLVGAMRDLLSNIRLPDVPNDADVDEDDDSDEDEEQNNYLT